MGERLSNLFRLAILFFVPAVVWTTLAAGVYQLVRAQVRRLRPVPRRSHALVQKTAP